MTPIETLALIIAEQARKIESMRADLDILRFCRKDVVEECACVVESWDRGHALWLLADKIRALAEKVGG